MPSDRIERRGSAEAHAGVGPGVPRRAVHAAKPRWATGRRESRRRTGERRNAVARRAADPLRAIPHPAAGGLRSCREWIELHDAVHDGLSWLLPRASLGIAMLG